MDCRTGDIYPGDLIQQLIRSGAVARARFKPMAFAPSADQLARKPPRVGRNDLCPCGSGKKFKRCCLESPIPNP